MDKPISQIIKEKREQLGFSIDEISEKIFIPPKFLRSIEEEKWNKFFSKTHLKGFLKKYLSFLHIPVEILSQYPEIFSETNDSQTKQPQSTSVSKELYWTITGKKIIAITVAIVIVFIIIIVGTKTKSIRKTGVPYVYNTTPRNTIFKPLSFSLEATENVWVQAKSNGKIVLEKTLNKGMKENLKGENISLRIGNAGGLIIIYNRKTFGPFGKKGEVKDITIDKSFFHTY